VARNSYTEQGEQRHYTVEKAMSSLPFTPLFSRDATKYLGRNINPQFIRMRRKTPVARCSVEKHSRFFSLKQIHLTFPVLQTFIVKTGALFHVILST
jgi:hypothetical protein